MINCKRLKCVKCGEEFDMPEKATGRCPGCDRPLGFLIKGIDKLKLDERAAKLKEQAELSGKIMVR